MSDMTSYSCSCRHRARNTVTKIMHQVLGGGSTGSIHSYDAAETRSCAEWITATLHPENDPDLSHLFPDGQSLTAASSSIANADRRLFAACKDGWLLAKMLNACFPALVDLQRLKRAPKMKIQATANVEVVLARARTVGVRLNNIGPEDVWAGTPQLCLGLIWQVIKV